MRTVLWFAAIAIGAFSDRVAGQATTIVQEAYVKASNTGEYDDFGWELAVDGDTLVIGARFEDSKATGVGGDESDDSAPGAGAVYVFVLSPTGWVQQAYLKASNTEASDRFGDSVAISGDTIVVGASHEDSKATGVGGDQANNSMSNAGAAYVFVRTGTVWAQEGYLKASHPNPGDYFGRSVGVDGDLVVVGVDEDDSQATGVNGSAAANAAPQAGAAYVFVRNGTSWSQEAYLKPANTQAADHFGISVAISGNTIAVGAHLEDSGLSGINPFANNEMAPEAGAVYVFVRTGMNWSQQAYVKALAPGPGQRFGHRVALHQDTLVVGSRWETGSGVGIWDANPDPLGIQLNAGAAWVFERDGTQWAQQAFLKGSNADKQDWFGSDVAVHGDRILVGAKGEKSVSTMINGDQGNSSLLAHGAAYLYQRSAETWIQQAYLKPSNLEQNDDFGWRVALSSSRAVVASLDEDSGATGVGGRQSNQTIDSGAAYVFDTTETPSIYCSPKVSSAGCTAAILTNKPAATPVSGASGYAVTAVGVQGFKVGLLCASLGAAAIPFNGGTLCVQPPIKRGPIQSSGGTAGTCDGTFSAPVNLGVLLPAGLDAGAGNSGYYQWWYRDPMNGPGQLGTALSNAVRLDFQ